MQWSDLGLQTIAAATVPLLPLVWRQGQRVREEMPRLPEASGPTTGRIEGTGLPIRLLVFGESTAAGVGAPNHRHGLAGQTAEALAEYTGRPIFWQVHGQRGVTARAAHDGLLPTLSKASFDVVVVALGVNDVIELHGPMRWQHDLGRLVADLRARTDHPPVMVAGMPPIGQFPVLPQPLQTVLGWRGQLLDHAARNLARSARAMTHVTTPLPDGDEGFCADGFHPSPAGYAAWGQSLARAAAKTLRRRR